MRETILHARANNDDAETGEAKQQLEFRLPRSKHYVEFKDIGNGII